ncbi:MAG TPA: tetratricopeptide repeat protein, partial [Pseudonocardiaceae bacterium]
MRAAADAEATAIELHGRGRDLLASGQPLEAARVLRRALRLLGRPPDSSPAEGLVEHRPAVARLLITLAVTEVYLDRPDAGFALLDEAEKLVPPEELGIVVQQRGAMLVVTGRLTDAVRELDEAVALLTRSGQHVVLARTLNSRGVLHHNAGRFRLARADLEACERLARELPGEHRLLAKATHNHALCDLLQGDIPGALRNLALAAEQYHLAGAPALVGPVSVDRARALLAAGLATEAAAELDSAMERLSPRTGGRERA